MKVLKDKCTLKILIFSLNYYPKYVGGAEVAIKEIVERLNPHVGHGEKFEFHMVTLRFDSSLPKYEIVHGIHVHRIGFTKKNASITDLKNSYLKYNKFIYQVYAAIFAMKLHRQEKFDAIWAMMAHAAAVPAGIFKFFNKNVKYILTLQEGDPPEYIEKIFKPIFPLFKYGFTSADIVQSISTFLDKWAGKMGNTGYRVVIPNAVDVKQFTRKISHEEIQNVKNILGKKEGQVWLITTSRLVYKNGVDDVIKAMKDLPEKFHFAILGIGPEEENYKNLVKDLKLENRVHFVGEIKHPQMAVYLRACDIFIRSSRSEGMGNSFVEAMSLKMPVVATTEGGLADFIFDQKTAFVVQKNDPQSILGGILKIDALDKVLKQEILENAYKMVLEKYDWKKIVYDMETQVFSKI